MSAATKTIRFTLFFLILAASLSKSQAQLRPITLQWAKSFGGSGTDRANTVIQAANGDFVIAGQAASRDGMVTDNYLVKNQWIVRTNAAGNILWKKSYGSFGSGIYSIIQTSDGGFAAAGMAGGITGSGGTSADFWVLKTDANGNIEWEKTFGGSEQDLAYAIIQTSDGGYAVAGLTGSFNGDVIYRPGVSDYSFWVIKLSPAGSLLWSKTYGGAAQDIANSIIETTDGGLAIAGSSYSNSGDVLDHKGRYTGNAWMVKTNSNGDIQWSKSYGGVGIVAVYKIVQTSDGGFAMAGIADRNGGDITGLHERGDYYYDYLLIRTDPSGTLQWSKCYGGTNNDYCYSLTLSRYGGFILAGHSESYDGDRKDYMGWADYWIVSVDDAGNIRWTKSYGGSNLEIGSSIAETNNGGLIIAGTSASYDGHITDHIGRDDFWVVRLNFKIATARLSSHQYCPGDSITIKDTLFGAFNRNNTFSVQLSDENGSFLTPSTIAQFPNSHEDSLFRVKLPEQVKTGTHYRIRVISNSPEAIYTDNGQDITIHEQPAFTNDFLGKDTVLCNTGPLLLQAPATPGFHYTWQDNSSNHNYTVTTTGKYYLTVVNTGGCSTTDTILVDFKAPPIFTLGNDEGICPGNTLTLQPVLPAGNYEWSNGSRAATITITDPGLYWLQVSGNGCTKRDSILVNAKQNPVVNLGSDTTICEGQVLYLDVTNNNATYTWQDGTTRSNYTVKQPGLYTVKVIMDGCDNEAAIAVAYKTKPAVELGKDTTVCSGASITLQAAYPGAIYQWSDGTTGSFLQVTREGKYMVSLTNSCGTNSDSIQVNYENCSPCRYVLPDAFSPNGDGNNDIFRPLYNCPVSNFKWQIYNRWGQNIFISENPTKGWDGQLAGIQQPTGAYVWMVQYTDPVTGKAYQNKGTVLLIR